MSTLHTEYLLHILDETEYLLNVCKGLSKDDLIQDDTLKRAVVRSLEIIGEATKKIPNSFIDKYPNVEWRSMARMRDVLIHDYFGIDYDIVWDVLIQKIPKLNESIKDILKKET